MQFTVATIALASSGLLQLGTLFAAAATGSSSGATSCGTFTSDEVYGSGWSKISDEERTIAENAIDGKHICPSGGEWVGKYDGSSKLVVQKKQDGVCWGTLGKLSEGIDNEYTEC